MSAMMIFQSMPNNNGFPFIEQRFPDYRFPYISAMATEYGKRLRLARKGAGLTQGALSKKTGIAQSTISTAEREGRGSSETPVYAQACGVNAMWLAKGDGEMKPGVLAALDGSAQPQINERRLAYRAVSVESAVEAIANHLDAVDGYDRPTVISLLTTLANSPDMHAVVAAGIKALKPKVRGDPAEKQMSPAQKDRNSRAA